MRLVPLSMTPAVPESATYTGNFETGPIPMEALCPGGTKGRTIWIRCQTDGNDYNTYVLEANPDGGSGYTEVKDATGAGISAVMTAQDNTWNLFVLVADYPYLQLRFESGGTANTVEAYIVVD